jgi:hypothetical protein
MIKDSLWKPRTSAPTSADGIVAHGKVYVLVRRLARPADQLDAAGFHFDSSEWDDESLAGRVVLWHPLQREHYKLIWDDLPASVRRAVVAAQPTA